MTQALIPIEGQHFKQDVLQAKQPVLVDFSASWCGPCKMLTPILEELQGEYKDITFYKMDIDDQANREVVQEHSIMSVPTLILFKKGVAVGSILGLQSKEKIKAFLQEHLTN
jgi:thioredoxin 1